MWHTAHAIILVIHIRLWVRHNEPRRQRTSRSVVTPEHNTHDPDHKRDTGCVRDLDNTTTNLLRVPLSGAAQMLLLVLHLPMRMMDMMMLCSASGKRKQDKCWRKGTRREKQPDRDAENISGLCDQPETFLFSPQSEGF